MRLKNIDVLKAVAIVGIKSFGISNGQFYIKLNKTYYFNQRTKMNGGYFEKNEVKELCGNMYLGLIGLVVDSRVTVPVFTPDHHFISQGCGHSSKGIWFSQMID